MRAQSFPHTSRAAECQHADCRKGTCAPQVDSGGFASIGNVTEVPPHQFNKMESFWLSGALRLSAPSPEAWVCSLHGSTACHA